MERQPKLGQAGSRWLVRSLLEPNQLLSWYLLLSQWDWKSFQSCYDLPFDNGSSGIFQNLLPVFESRFVSLGLIPAQHNFTNGVTTTNHIVVTYLRKHKYIWYISIQHQEFNYLSHRSVKEILTFSKSWKKQTSRILEWNKDIMSKKKRKIMINLTVVN